MALSRPYGRAGKKSLYLLCREEKHLNEKNDYFCNKALVE